MTYVCVFVKYPHIFKAVLQRLVYSRDKRVCAGAHPEHNIVCGKMASFVSQCLIKVKVYLLPVQSKYDSLIRGRGSFGAV